MSVPSPNVRVLARVALTRVPSPHAAHTATDVGATDATTDATADATADATTDATTDAAADATADAAADAAGATDDADAAHRYILGR